MPSSMTSNNIDWTKIVAAIFILVFAAGTYIFAILGIKHTLLDPTTTTPIAQAHIADMPTFEDIQRMLIERGYDIGTHGIDGRIGCPDSNSQKAWQRAICDQEAPKMFERMEKGK